MDSGRVEVINVLSSDYYDKIHIAGSKNIPLERLDVAYRDLDKAKHYVVYCASQQCDASRKAARLLEEKGFSVKAYEGGIKEWAEAGLPTEGSTSREEFLAAQ